MVPLAQDADQVLRKCRQLRESIRAQVDDTDAPEPAGIPQNIIEVADLSSPQVLEAMEAVALKIASQVLNKRGFVLDIPSRAASNQIYVKEWDRIVLGGKRSTRTFLNVKEARKSAITVRVMQLLHAV
jgi:meiotic recombination protein SPO11